MSFFRLVLFAFLLLKGMGCLGQVIPAAGDTLNFTQIMFDMPASDGAKAWRIQVASPDDDFKKTLSDTVSTAPAIILDNFAFGQSYQWRYLEISNQKKQSWKGPYTFYISNEDSLNKSGFKCFILTNHNKQHCGGLIIADCNAVAYNRQGKAVWYLPRQSTKSFTPVYRDMRISPAGTVTCLMGKEAIECNLKGHEIWRGPLKETTPDPSPFGLRENFHHDFKRLANGHYMVLSGVLEERKVPAYIDTSKINLDKPGPAKAAFKRINGALFTRVMAGCINEYDSAGHLVWQWNSGNYFKEEDLFPPGLDLNGPLEERDTHLNAFSLDESGQFVYAGFRNTGRIVKINKRTQQVVQSWGSKSHSGEYNDGRNFFKRQHDSNILPDGTIAIFNNDTMGEKTSHVVILSQGTEANPSKITWQFNCNIDSLTRAKSTIGGNVELLPDNNFLVCTGNTDRIFEVTHDKRIVWNAIAGRKKINDTVGSSTPLYRAHYVSSLYPCYFTIQVTKGKANVLNIKIFNVGTEPDSYHIFCGTAGNLFFKSISTKAVKAGNVAEYSISDLHSGEPLFVNVTSEMNHALKREVRLP